VRGVDVESATVDGPAEPVLTESTGSVGSVSSASRESVQAAHASVTAASAAKVRRRAGVGGFI